MTRRFGAALALSNVTVSFSPGEVHVLVGGNGAGKGTLIKILSGADSDYRGELWLEGAKVRFRNPSQARALGIACIYQELSLVPNLSLVENIGLRRSSRSSFCPSLFAGAARGAAREEAKRLRCLMQLEVDLDREVRAFSLAEQQLIEVGAALLEEVGVLVLDEPTSALSEREAECLFEHLQRARAAGTSVIYISHRLEEVYRLADRISVLRDGELVLTAWASDLPQPELVRAMVGVVGQRPPRRGDEAAERSAASRPNQCFASTHWNDPVSRDWKMFGCR
ncbi:MAG TPA: ATP-binding cassette domain-containing protein [Polyangiaceae bacterium]|nr:ATP-binding cassette domain-containing protein [Polyangiaceae bacterium]